MEANFVQTSRSGSKTRRWPGKGRRKAAVSVAGGEECVKIIYTPTRRQEKTPQKLRQKKENVQTQQLLLTTNNQTSGFRSRQDAEKTPLQNQNTMKNKRHWETK